MNLQTYLRLTLNSYPVLGYVLDAVRDVGSDSDVYLRGLFEIVKKLPPLAKKLFDAIRESGNGYIYFPVTGSHPKSVLETAYGEFPSFCTKV